MFGRKQIFTRETEITIDNLIDVLEKAIFLHQQNVNEINFLDAYRRGMQPILQRTKEVRSTICNRIVVNNADQIVAFKNGYFLNKPAFYVSRKDDKDTVSKVKELNEYLYVSGKQQADNKLVNWFHTVGIGTLYIEPNKEYDKEEKPVNVYALDPRSAFCVYSLAPGNKALMGVHIAVQGDREYYDCFTKNVFYRVVRVPHEVEEGVIEYTNQISQYSANVIGEIPIIEYTYNENRMGAFENALDIMDAINTVESNRVDGVEQFIQSLIVTTNVDFDENTTSNTIRDAGMVCLRSIGENKADIKVITEELDQTQTQTLIDNLYDQLLDKVGLPSISRGSASTSDTGSGVFLRQGWSSAEANAQNCEDLFRESNKNFDRAFLSILRKAKEFNISINDFDLKMERTITSNLLIKSQVALNLKQLGLSPEIVLEKSGISNDPISDVENSRKYIDKAYETKEEETPQIENPQENINMEREELTPNISVD